MTKKRTSKTKQLFEQITQKLASEEIYFQIIAADCFLIWEEKMEEEELTTHRVTTITHQVKIGDLSLTTKFYLEKSLNRLAEHLQEKISIEEKQTKKLSNWRKIVDCKVPLNNK